MLTAQFVLTHADEAVIEARRSADRKNIYLVFKSEQLGEAGVTVHLSNAQADQLASSILIAIHDQLMEAAR